VAATASFGIYEAVAGRTTPYDKATAYTQMPPPFTPRRTVDVTSGSPLLRAVASLRAGDLVKATADFTLNHHAATGHGLVISKRFSAPAVIDLTGVKIVYSGGSNSAAVWVRNSQNIRIYGGDVSTSDTGGSCIDWYGSQHVLWWGFKAHDCGGTGIGITTAKSGYRYAGPVQYDDIQGEIWKMGQHRQWDHHQEKCSGLHGANLADHNDFAFANNRFALYVHDSNCEGSGIQFGTYAASPLPMNNTIYLRCAKLTFISTIQTGGNCYQTWGYGNRYTEIRYLQADDITGHAYWAHGLYHKPNTYLSTDVVKVGRTSNTRQNPRYEQDPDYDETGGTVFSFDDRGATGK
jgi:hypothetical protein